MLVVRNGPSACDFEGCNRKPVAKGLCGAHYQQRANGYALVPIDSNLSIEDRLRARRRITESGCWEWTGKTLKTGYATTSLTRDGIPNRGGKYRLVHRIAYEVWKGPVDGLVVHHKCHNRRCFNPDHLEIASRLTNHLEMLERKSLKGRIAWLEHENRRLASEIAVLKGETPVSTISEPSPALFSC